jgi:hypothetical protein
MWKDTGLEYSALLYSEPSLQHNLHTFIFEEQNVHIAVCTTHIRMEIKYGIIIGFKVKRHLVMKLNTWHFI